MKPRYTPPWDSEDVDDDGDTIFLGYAGELDAYVQLDNTRRYLVVGPVHRLLDPGISLNFDAYSLRAGSLMCLARQDLHIDLSEMCEVYQLLEAGGYLKQEKSDGAPV